MFTGVFSHHNRLLVINKPNQACKDSSIGPLELNLLLSLWLRIVELDEVICTDSPTFKLSRRAILSCWFRWLIRLSLAPPKRLNVLCCLYTIVSLWQLFTCEQECHFLVSFLNRMLCPTFTEFTLILCLHLMVKYCEQ